MKLFSKHSRAFTLIEIMFVVSIIFTLSSVVITETNKSRVKANDVSMQQQVKQVENSLYLFKNDRGIVPKNYNCGGSYCGGGGGDTVAREGTQAYNESMQDLVDEGVIAEIPTSPDGESYAYFSDEVTNTAYFVAELARPIGGGNRNSCEGVVVNSFENCVERWCSNGSVYINKQSNVGSEGDLVCEDIPQFNTSQFCNAWEDVYEEDICYPQSLGSFCSENNNDPSICPPGFIIYPLNLTNIAVTCDLPEDIPCSGSNDSDFCSCI